MKPKVKLQLVDDWKAKFWRSWAVRLSALSGILQAVFIAWPTAMLDIWNVLPEPARAVLPYRVAAFMPLGLTLAAMWARVIMQERINGK